MAGEGVTGSRVVGVVRNDLLGVLKSGFEAVDGKVEAAIKEQDERLEQYQKVCVGGGRGAGEGGAVGGNGSLLTMAVERGRGDKEQGCGGIEEWSAWGSEGWR